MKYRVNIARSRREYADIVVEAPTSEVAEAFGAELLTADTDEANDALNSAAWNDGDETFDADIIDVIEHEDDDDADVTVPEGWSARAEAPTPQPYTLIGIYWDDHKPFVQHVHGTDAHDAEMAGGSNPRKDAPGDEQPFSILAVLEGWHTPANDLTTVDGGI